MGIYDYVDGLDVTKSPHPGSAPRLRFKTFIHVHDFTFVRIQMWEEIFTNEGMEEERREGKGAVEELQRSPESDYQTTNLTGNTEFYLQVGGACQ